MQNHRRHKEVYIFGNMSEDYLLLWTIFYINSAVVRWYVLGPAPESSRYQRAVL